MKIQTNNLKNKIILKIISDFNNSFGNYNSLKQGKLINEFHRLNTRLDLVNGTKISFNKTIKGDDYKSSLSKLIKLNDIWFTYEAFLNFLYADKKVANIKSKTETFSSTIYESSTDVDAKSVLDEVNEILRENILNNNNRINDFSNLIDALKVNAGKRQKKLLDSSLLSIKKGNNLNHRELMGIVYAIRNSFVHSGNTSIQDIGNYKLSMRLFDVLGDFILLSICKIFKYYY